MSSLSPHQPVRPGWHCAACNDEWPCARRKDELYLECDGLIVALSLLMSQYYADAAADSPNTRAHLLWLRFVAWVRPFVAVRRETAFINSWAAQTRVFNAVRSPRDGT